MKKFLALLLAFLLLLTLVACGEKEDQNGDVTTTSTTMNIHGAPVMRQVQI